jgi:hypothetical protein
VVESEVLREAVDLPPTGVGGVVPCGRLDRLGQLDEVGHGHVPAAWVPVRGVPGTQLPQRGGIDADAGCGGWWPVTGGVRLVSR